MDKRDLYMVRKHITNLDFGVIQKIESCYVDKDKSLYFQPAQSTFKMDESDIVQYLSFFRKSLTGKKQKNVFEISSMKKNLLKELHLTKMEDQKAVSDVCQSIADTYDYSEAYYIILAYGVMDIPHKDKDDETYDFVLVSLHPSNLSRSGFIYDRPQNKLIKKLPDLAVGDPEQSFLYPSLNGMYRDLEHVLYTVKNEKNIRSVQSLMENFWKEDIPLSLEKQKKALENILKAAFDQKISYTAVQELYENIEEMTEEKYENREILSTEEIKKAIENCDSFDKDRVEDVAEELHKYKNCQFNCQGLIPEKIILETESGMIKINQDKLREIQKRRIDGVDYFLIPANETAINDIFLD